MKILNKIRVILCFLCITEYIQARELAHEFTHELTEAAEQLVQLRRAQQQAWGSDFFALEQVIAQVKQRYNKVYISDSYAWLHAVPLMAKQILFVILWWILLFCVKLILSHRRGQAVALFLLLLTVSVTVLSVKKQEQAVVICTTPLYIGPDCSYPVKATLYPLDELTVVQQVGSWYYTITPACGWVQKETITKI